MPSLPDRTWRITGAYAPYHRLTVRAPDKESAIRRAAEITKLLESRLNAFPMDGGEAS